MDSSIDLVFNYRGRVVYDGKYDKEEKKELILYEDSVLYKLPQLQDDSIDLVITSPRYCNRYDYTRTYALELAFLGTGLTGPILHRLGLLCRRL